VEQVAGALRYTQYDFFKKFTLRMIAKRAGGSTDTSHDTEYTDWKQVNEILMKLKI
jgi:menaquinone-dependent protoporphyrinogen oxidase